MTEQRRPRVFITQQTRNGNFAGAESFGEAVFVTRQEIRPLTAAPSNAAVVFDVAQFARTYDPETDYICPVGNPCTTALMMGAAMLKTTHIRVLKWDNRNFQYDAFVIDVTKIKETIET